MGVCDGTLAGRWVKVDGVAGRWVLRGTCVSA